MDSERGRDAQDEALKPKKADHRAPEGTATEAPKRDDGAQAIEVENLNSADDEGAN